MVQFSPESPCTPPMSPSSAADLENKCKADKPTAKLAISDAPETKKEAPTQPAETTAKEDPTTEQKPPTKNEDEVLSEVSETTSSAAEEPKIELENVHIRIQKRPNPLRETEEVEYETFILPSMVLPEKPTLDSIRESLLSCELGRPERDIFFPTWTKSLYICWRLPSAPDTDDDKTPCSPSTAPESAPSLDPSTTPTPTPESADAENAAAEEEVQFSETETVESDAALQAAVAREQSTPGTLCLLLQECRNLRYSRKRDKRTGKNGSLRPHSPPGLYNPGMFYGQPPLAFPVYAKAGSGKSRADGTVYFDGPLTFAYPLPPHPGYGCTPGQPPAPGYPHEFAYLPPYAVVPFMYPPHGARH